MVEEVLNITLGEVGGKSEVQTDTDSELRRRQMDGPGKNGLAEIFGAGYGADWGQIIVGARFQACTISCLDSFEEGKIRQV
jgi:hypothetical protein